jgi:hypothetical protein
VTLLHAIWKKSTYSNTNGCVEVKFVDGQVAVRNSREPKGPVLVFSSKEWDVFLRGLREGQFNATEGQVPLRH